MAPKGKNKAQPKAATPKAATLPPREAPKTIGEKLRFEYDDSRPFQTLSQTLGLKALNSDQQLAYANAILLESQTYRQWSPAQQKEFLAHCEKLKIPYPRPPPRDLGKDRKGRPIADYTLEEYDVWQKQEEELQKLRSASEQFKVRAEKLKAKPVAITDLEKFSLTSQELLKSWTTPITEDEIREEKTRRAIISHMEKGKKVGKYEGDPTWDNVTPIPQDDGEQPLAAIAYTDEYAEAIAYLRAIMASGEHSARVLDLTAHVISLNPAHYTVWLYRASTLFALNSSITDELEWVNSVALANQKNYQIWHHRQLLISKIFPTLKTRDEVADLARSEIQFVTKMFEEDSKNYHVWSYRQYLVRTLSLFPSEVEDLEGLSELSSVESLIQQDVRNNSAWSHRFFVVFSDPGFCTPSSKATEPDPKIPSTIVDREIEFSKAAIWRAPNNQSPWNYLKGVLRKGGKKLQELECFAGDFAKIDGDAEEVKSSHALDFLADAWAEEGEKEKADKALRLLGEKYDRIRKNYWEWRRESLGLESL